jgi:hypothetical protein
MRFANILPLFTLALAACAVETDAVDGHEAILIAAVERPSGSLVEFLTTDEGGVLVAEQWRLGNLPTLPPATARHVDPRDYYRALTGDEAPEELALLVEASGVPYRRYAPSELVLGDEVTPAKNAVPASYFEDSVCHQYPGAERDWCHLDQTVETKHKKSDINGISASACADRGEVEFRIAIRKRNDWNRKSYFLDAGLCAQYTMDRFLDFDGESWVMQVGAGDRYHHAGMMCWDWGGSCPVFAPPLPE